MIHYQLDDKVAVVTGGASGIGLACAHVLARSGAAVALWDLGQSSLDAAAAELEPYGQAITTAVVDVSDSARVDAAMAEVVAGRGGVDIVVGNAGIGGEAKPAGDYSDRVGTRSSR